MANLQPQTIPDCCEQASLKLPERETIEDLGALFKMFADPTRVSILLALQPGGMCVCELCEVVNMEQSAVSHQLRLLRAGNLVTGTRQGRHVFYSLADNHVNTILSQGTEHVLEEK